MASSSHLTDPITFSLQATITHHSCDHPHYSCKVTRTDSDDTGLLRSENKTRSEQVREAHKFIENTIAQQMSGLISTRDAQTHSSYRIYDKDETRKEDAIRYLQSVFKVFPQLQFLMDKWRGDQTEPKPRDIGLWVEQDAKIDLTKSQCSREQSSAIGTEAEYAKKALRFHTAKEVKKQAPIEPRSAMTLQDEWNVAEVEWAKEMFEKLKSTKATSGDKTAMVLTTITTSLPPKLLPPILK